jgi:ribosomal protein S2
LKKKVDLIVVFNIDNNINAVNEGHIARIPVIGGFSSEVPENLDFTGKISYKIPGHFVSFDERNKSSNFFVSLVKTVLKKSVINYSKESVLKYSK